MTNLHFKKSISRSPLRWGCFLIALVWFAVSLVARADSPTNTRSGVQALHGNTIGIDNSAFGYQVLGNNTAGSWNTASGANALFSNTDGLANAAVGFEALRSNVNGSQNTASGFSALRNSTGANNNTAIGSSALFNQTVGNDNIAVGFEAGFNLTTGEDNIDIGNRGKAGESATIRIGNGGGQTKTFIAGISEATVSGAAVFVNADGQLGTAPSSQRFKKEIKPMDKVSEAILALEPVTFRYKKEFDPKCIPQFGLVAEEVAKVNPDLVVRDKEGKPYTVRYEAVNAMLLNEFLKEHRKVQEQDARVTRQEAFIARQQKQIEVLTAGLTEQAAQIQKVSAQLELSKSAPQTVLNNQ